MVVPVSRERTAFIISGVRDGELFRLAVPKRYEGLLPSGIQKIELYPETFKADPTLQAVRRFLNWIDSEKEGLTVLKTIYLIDSWEGKIILVPTVPIIFRTTPKDINVPMVDVSDLPIF
jgi:hypothetical protein